MMKLLIIAASLGLATSAATACDYLRSAENVDETKVASVTTDDTQNMSTPKAPAETTVVIEDEATAPAETE